MIYLVTGGSGSFGIEFTTQMLGSGHTLRIYSRGEHRQEEMARRFGSHPSLRFFVGDVRDSVRLRRAMEGADTVVHAAALKIVPTAEYNPVEAVKTNVMGAINVINAAIDCGVEKVLAVSTDKAVYPINLYGATKLVSEKLFIQANAYTGTCNTFFSCVRYGNVVGSQGSVIPLWREQAKKGLITVTHPDMTRFWLTLQAGVQFALYCIGIMKGGEIFVPKVKSNPITRLAKITAPDAEIDYTGIRPGEKLHEVLITEEEVRHTDEFENYYMIRPEYQFRDVEYPKGRPLPEGFVYSSERNPNNED